MPTIRRPRETKFRRLACIVACVIVTFAQPAIAADNVWSVQKLNDSKPWDKFVDSGLSLRIEGRMGSSGGGQFRLQKCDAKFTVDSTKLKQSQAKSSSTIEVKGRFKKDGTKFEFAVDDLKVVSGFAEQYDLRASKLRLPKPEDWVELGDWAAERGHFYDDAELLKKAEEAYTNAVDLEYKSLKLTDAEGRFALAKKVESYKLSSRRRMELIHDGLRVEWQTLQKAEPVDLAAWKKFMTSVASQLPGTDKPLKTVPAEFAELKESYEQDPVSAYQSATDKVRLQLHRLFFVAMTRRLIMQNASSDGRDGDTIAEQIDQQIPEEHALAEKQRALRLGYRLSKINTATRVEAENLAATFRQRQQPDNARLALVQWVKNHEPRLKADGVVGLTQLADEYLSLLNDEKTAVEYLTDAYKLDPSFEEVRSKFGALGYQLRNNRWVKTDPNHVDPLAPAAPSPTGINIGMTATSLRTLLGHPTSLSRIITGRGMTELWRYGPTGSSPLIVRLEQKSRDLEPKVTALSGQ